MTENSSSSSTVRSTNTAFYDKNMRLPSLTSLVATSDAIGDAWNIRLPSLKLEDSDDSFVDRKPSRFSQVSIGPPPIPPTIPPPAVPMIPPLSSFTHIQIPAIIDPPPLSSSSSSSLKKEEKQKSRNGSKKHKPKSTKKKHISKRRKHSPSLSPEPTRDSSLSPSPSASPSPSSSSQSSLSENDNDDDTYFKRSANEYDTLSLPDFSSSYQYQSYPTNHSTTNRKRPRHISPSRIANSQVLEYGTKEEKLAHKRRMNAEAARRCRERKAARIANLETLVTTLESSNTELITRNALLQNALERSRLREASLEGRVRDLERCLGGDNTVGGARGGLEVLCRAAVQEGEQIGERRGKKEIRRRVLERLEE